MDEVEELLAEQLAYYRAHAPDYDLAYLGKQWDRCLDELPIAGDVLELACGTGHWTPLLAARASSVTDAAPEVLALARRRVGEWACFIDSSRRERADERVLPGQAAPTVWRRLRDGSDHRVVKVYYSPAELTDRLAELGWTAGVREASVGLLVGTARPRRGRAGRRAGF